MATQQNSLFDDDQEADLPVKSPVRPAKKSPRETIMSEENPIETPQAPSTKPKTVKQKPSKGRKATSADDKKKRTRTTRPYPVVSFREATVIGDAIFKFASGERVRRLTLLEKLERNPGSSATNMLITNSGKYGITTGSYAAEFLELTELGHTACNPDEDQRSRLDAQFKLAIAGIVPFKLLYDTYVGKKLPAHEVMKDRLLDGETEVDNPKECIDLFVVNVKDIGLLRTIAGAETLVSIDQLLDESSGGRISLTKHTLSALQPSDHQKKATATKWQNTCFYISPIGDEGSDARKHSDLFLSTLVEPALKELGLDVVRADKIAEPGMITTSVLEHIKLSRLVVADLSMLNPNVFYEMALRHAVKLPIVQIIRKADRLPFDVNQVNSIIIDNTDIYSFTPKIETYRSEITTMARRALEDAEHIGNPISAFFPDYWK
jgi:hypothetical protein